VTRETATTITLNMARETELTTCDYSGLYLGLGGSKIYNNVIAYAGYNYYPGNQSYPKYGIYTNDCTSIQGSEFDLMYNTIISPKTDGIVFASQKATVSLLSEYYRGSI